jgi:Protein of unknown function (DUF2806)
MRENDAKGPSSALSEFLNEFNLPKLLAGEAGKAISRLIGAAIDIPAAKLDAIAQTIRDRKEAKSALSSALGKAASESAVLDKDLVNRTVDRLLSDEVRKQLNREGVAKKTLEKLQEISPPENSSPVEEDWLDYFSSYTEKANSEKMRDLWSRVLSGEIRRPGSYSLETLRFMSELDQYTASVVEKYFSRVIRGNAIFDDSAYHSGKALVEVTLLENKGLVNGVGGLRNMNPSIDAEGILPIVMRSHALFVFGEIGKSIPIGSLILTRLGAEVLSILNLPDDVESLRLLAEKMQKDGLSKILLGSFNQTQPGKITLINPEIIWENPTPTLTPM